MIIYSVVPPEVIFSQHQEEKESIQHITFKEGLIEVTSVSQGQYRINRIISTSLKSFLDPKLQPGEMIYYNEQP